MQPFIGGCQSDVPSEVGRFVVEVFTSVNNFRQSLTDEYLAQSGGELANFFDVDLGELLPGHHVVLRGIERSMKFASPFNPLETLIQSEQLHYEHVPGLTRLSATPDWSATFFDDVGTSYNDREEGAYDGHSEGTATHGKRDIGNIPTEARVLTIVVGPSYQWVPPEPWIRSYEVVLVKTARKGW